MDNIRDLQAQARSLERSGQADAALELYDRMLGEPAVDRDGGMWVRAARLRLTLGRGRAAAEAFATAADRYESAGLSNLALAQYQHSLRSDDSQSDTLLRFGRLAAARGYSRDARQAFAEYADRAAAGNEVDAAAEALREYLARFPRDAAVRRRLFDLTGEEITTAAPVISEGSSNPAELLPGLVPTQPEQDREDEESPDAGGSSPGISSDPALAEAEAATRNEELTPDTVAPLEGFEPTVANALDPVALGAGARGEEELEGAIESGREAAEPENAEEAEPEPLPLLGLEPTIEPSAAPEPGASDLPVAAPDREELPLLGVDEPRLASPEVAAGPNPVDSGIQVAAARVAAHPDDLSARRELARALREAGDPGLSHALADADRYLAQQGRHAEALEFSDALARLHPEDTALQQLRVERALRAGDRPTLVEGYLALAARFEAELQGDRAREALNRVLELDPTNREARSALRTVSAPIQPSRDYVDLGELILSGAPEEVTRFQVSIGDPTGNEESDFAEILDLFRKKVSESLDPKDAASHYDLGLAFRQMGLLDDAIVHLQSGLRGGSNPLATLEVLGECFVLKGQTSLAARVFERATRLEGVGDGELVGVLYGLARCQEALGRLEEAGGTYERLVAVDLSFRDAAERLERLQSR